MNKGFGSPVMTAKDKIFDLSTGQMRDILLSALTARLKGTGHESYHFLVEHISKNSHTTLKYWLGGLTQCVSTLSEVRHKELFHRLWEFDWIKEDQETKEAYKHFLIHLVAAQNSFIASCFSVVLKGFIAPFNASKQHCEILHSAIAELLALVPSSTRILVQSVAENFPHQNAFQDKLHVHKFYAENALMITEYCPSIQDDIIEIMVEKMLKIDSSIMKHADDLPDILFSQDEQVQEQQDRERYATILDGLMSCMLRFLDTRCSNEDLRMRIFDLFLIKIFHIHILPTLKSKFVQFLVFHLAHLSPSFAESFLIYLRDRFQNDKERLPIRQISLDYLASFICRANFLPLADVHTILVGLVQQAHSYLDRTENLAPNLDTHLIFYTVCQAIFYVITYLSSKLLDNGGYEYLVSLQLDRLVTCPLNPLKFCVTSVSDAFATVADNLGIISISCVDLVERNRSMKFGMNFNDQNPLQSHFPFDPISQDLPLAAQFIAPYYNRNPDQWYEDDEDHTDQEASRESMSEASMEASTSFSSRLGSLDYSSFAASRFSQGSVGSVGSSY